MEACGGVWLEDGAASWIFGDSAIQGGRTAENVGSRWPASGPQWEFWRAYPECSGAEYGLEGQTHFAERSGCAIGIAALKMALPENRTLSENRTRRTTIGRTGFTTQRRHRNLACDVTSTRWCLLRHRIHRPYRRLARFALPLPAPRTGKDAAAPNCPRKPRHVPR